MRRFLLLAPLALAFALPLRAEPPAPEAEDLLRLIGARNGETIADVGCGKGTWTFWLAQAVGPRGKVTAVDIDARVLEGVRERVAKERWTHVEVLHSLPDDPRLAADSYDAVLLNDVIDYVDRGALVGFMAGIRAALKPDGRLVIRDPNGGSDRVIAECHRAGFALVEAIVPLRDAPPSSFAGGWYALKLRRAEPQHAILPRLGQPARHRTRLLLAEELFRAGLISRDELRATWERVRETAGGAEPPVDEALDLIKAAEALEVLSPTRAQELRSRLAR